MKNFNNKFLFIFAILIVVLGMFLVPKVFGLKHAWATSSICNINDCGGCDNSPSCLNVGCQWDGEICSALDTSTPTPTPTPTSTTDCSSCSTNDSQTLCNSCNNCTWQLDAYYGLKCIDKPTLTPTPTPTSTPTPIPTPTLTPPIFPYCLPMRLDQDGEGKFIFTTNCYGDWDGGGKATHIQQIFTSNPEYLCTTVDRPVFKETDCDDSALLVQNNQNENLFADIFKRMSKGIFNFAQARPLGKCYWPPESHCDLTNPWQIYRAETYTVGTTDANDISRCKLATVFWDKNKKEVQSLGKSKEVACGMPSFSPVISITVADDSLPSFSVRLDAEVSGSWFNTAS